MRNQNVDKREIRRENEVEEEILCWRNYAEYVEDNAGESH